MADEYPLWDEMKVLNDDGFPLLAPSIDNPHTIKGVAGTPFYAAPEVLDGQEYSYGVDYYSLAIVYHEMVTGYVSFPTRKERKGCRRIDQFFLCRSLYSAGPVNQGSPNRPSLLTLTGRTSTFNLFRFQITTFYPR